MCLQPGDVAVSLGTSDTVFLWLDQPTPTLEGHIFCNPIDPEAYMALLCFKNGSLTREAIRNQCANRSWEEFEALLSCIPPGNYGFIGMFFDEEEITPKIRGYHRFDAQGQKLERFENSAIEIRALIEGQFLAKRVHAERLGFTFGPQCRILATGGASNNKTILQVLSDVFNADVFTQVRSVELFQVFYFVNSGENPAGHCQFLLLGICLSGCPRVPGSARRDVCAF